MQYFFRLKENSLDMLSGVPLEKFSNTSYPLTTLSLLIVYVLLSTVLMWNMLIAMMGDTFSKVVGDADMQWHLEWARIILSIENELTPEERTSDKYKYWTEIGGQRYLLIQAVNHTDD
eukprot:TRINITY_DN4088_c0_g1_i5.p1 TRINITY_DN4088_c0_g1~~TRINITY_DN4088_c0_g1_i5.p1  ORF type:complete len:118 (-),score=9.81 TRINITY_DN4088_c0_g1_i5:38-391(-)